MLARLMSRLSRPYVQTFQTQTPGATRQFGSKSGCGATLDATHVQTFQFSCPDSNSRRNYSFWVWIRMRRDHGGYGATFETKSEYDRFSRPSGDVAVFQFKSEIATKAETARLSRPRQDRRQTPDIGKGGVFFQTKAKTPRPKNNSSLDTERFSWTSNNLYFSPLKNRKSFKP